MNYKTAIVKFNNGRGALLCNACCHIITEGLEHPDREHICIGCGDVAANLRFHLKEKVEDKTDLDLAKAWDTFAMTEGYPDLSNFMQWIET